MRRHATGQVLELRDVGFRYPDGSLGLDRCTLAIRRGSRTAVLGVNGAGKTTLFLHLNGLLRPQTGMVLHDGVPLDYSRPGLRGLRSKVGLVFQNPDSQLFSASVREDVSFGPMNLGLDRETVERRVEEALLSVGMTALADKPGHNLSHGQKKRVCIAGVLAMQPEVLVLDEPMAGLDVGMQAELAQILDRLHAEGMTILIATHDLDFAYQWAEVISVMVEASCAASWDAAMLHEALDQLKGYGLGVPKVAELRLALVAAGALNVNAPLARSHQALMRQLADAALPLQPPLQPAV